MLTRQQRTISRTIAAGSAILTTLLAFGCGAVNSADGGEAGPEPAPPQARSSAPATSDLAAPASDAATPAAPPAAPHQCVAADLALALQGGDGAAGTVYRSLTFTNKSGKPCVMTGFPGVSFVTGDSGKQVGTAAFREGRKGSPVTIPVGGTASAPVGFTQVDNFDPKDCKKTTVRGLRVYPPHDTASMFVPMSGSGCAGDVSQFGNQLTVETVR